MPDEASRSPESSSRGGAGLALLVAVLLFLLPVLYVLSVGPVIWITYHCGLEGMYWEWFYWPLGWWHEHVEFTRPFLEWYVDLWP